MNPCTNIPDPPCGHGRSQIRVHGHRAECSECKSFWDIESLCSDIVYDKSYPESRFHFDPVIGKAKVRTLRHWLVKSGTETAGLKVCEVGFGGGYCLRHLMDVSGEAYGIETIEENITNATRLGLKQERMFHTGDLPDRLPERIDIWFFLDSFEHLPAPGAFMDWVRNNSSPDASVFTVMPRADSISERLMGRMWPHKLNDHRFHWSSRGIIEFFSRKGFAKVEKTFYPLKYVTLKTVMGHMAEKLGIRRSPSGSSMGTMPADIAFLFNIGEMGIIFKRDYETEL